MLNYRLSLQKVMLFSFKSNFYNYPIVKYSKEKDVASYATSCLVWWDNRMALTSMLHVYVLMHCHGAGIISSLVS